jgi:hypothetical protein
MGVMTRAAMRNLKNRREWVEMPEAEANLPKMAMAPKQAAEININPIPSKWPIFSLLKPHAGSYPWQGVLFMEKKQALCGCI